MTKKYLGEKIVDIKDTKFAGFNEKDWSLYFIRSYGQNDGGHHKLWVLDQVSKILTGSKIEVKLATWTSGEKEYRVSVLDETKDYYDFRKEAEGYIKDSNGEWILKSEDEHLNYDVGIAP